MNKYQTALISLRHIIEGLKKSNLTSKNILVIWQYSCFEESVGVNPHKVFKQYYDLNTTQMGELTYALLDKNLSFSQIVKNFNRLAEAHDILKIT